MELIDKCVHCGKPKDKHYSDEGILGQGNYCYCSMSTKDDVFQSITVAAAEKNAVRNLELLIEAKRAMETVREEDDPYRTISTALYKIIQAIEDSTPNKNKP